MYNKLSWTFHSISIYQLEINYKMNLPLHYVNLYQTFPTIWLFLSSLAQPGQVPDPWNITCTIKKILVDFMWIISLINTRKLQLNNDNDFVQIKTLVHEMSKEKTGVDKKSCHCDKRIIKILICLNKASSLLLGVWIIIVINHDFLMTINNC